MITKTHDISRLRFLDFDSWPMVMNLKFNICNLQIEQDIVAVFGEHVVQVFQILKGIVSIVINIIYLSILYILMNFVLIVDIKKESNWNTNNLSSPNTNNTLEKIDPPDISSSGPIDLNQLIKTKNDSYLRQLVNPKCFPIMMLTPGFDNNALIEQEKNAPFNIIDLPVIVNETEANDVYKVNF